VDVFLCDLVVDPSPQILVFKLFLQNAQAGQVLLQGYFIFYFLRLKAEIPALPGENTGSEDFDFFKEP